MNKISTVLATTIILSGAAIAETDRYDLDDIRQMDIVSLETCLDAAYDTQPGGAARKLEMKVSDSVPIYEFDIEMEDGITFNVECDARTGLIVEIEQEVGAEHSVFNKLAKVDIETAKATALMFIPGKVVESEREISYDGSVTYEFDIVNDYGREYKVDIDAKTGEFQEAALELYEIGYEKEFHK
ncbi:MAG: peptidase [Alteromonadaceae bacterium]|nr:peptidase [Alteromonadaceae bacterium]